jgi:ribonucleoside-triphosphate reductase (thioredoxin)
MSIKALSDYTVYAKYARYNEAAQRRETWKEQVSRVFSMHEQKYAGQLAASSRLTELFDFARQAVLQKRVLGSQRALQFGGDPILKRNDKIYNCAVTYIDRPRVFSEIMYMLLCGCGVGFSVQKQHVAKLPPARPVNNALAELEFVVPDSIEGWADAVGVLINSYYDSSSSIWPKYSGRRVKFNFSQIRPKGSMISGGFIAPGPAGLDAAIERIRTLINARVTAGLPLRPIDYYDVIMHSSDAVLSGGVRRSATICLFSPDDDDMLNAKVGDWYYKNPQRGRSNNSALLVRDETTREFFTNIIKSVKEYGEPGFVFAENRDIVVNPCVEIGMRPQTADGRSGVQYCNLTEINGKKCSSVDEFMQACEAAAILGTLQAGYTDFEYLGPITEEIVRRESLLGCSITGMMDSPEILFNPELQRKGAERIKEVNREVAALLGINPSARCTAVKPAGTTSCVLGTASGIHPHHSKRYFRRVQANRLEFPAQEFARVNPLAVEDSVWSADKTDIIITFLCEVPPGAVVKNQLSAIDLLERVKLTQQNWVEYGTNETLCTDKTLRHNVSNTITVKPDEWEAVANYIYDNRKFFAGISLLGSSGDKDLPQTPFCTVHTPAEIVKEYGDAAVFASGVIVDALAAFDRNLWVACDHALDVLSLPQLTKKPVHPTTESAKSLAKYYKALEEYESLFLKVDWVRRAHQFADRYFGGDRRKMTYCLKDVHNWKSWCDLSRDYKDIDWSTVNEPNPFYTNVDTLGAQACSGGKCEL